MEIRRATADDAQCLAKVHVEAWRSAYKGIVPDSHLAKLDVSRQTERFRKWLSEPSGETYVAEQDSEIAGYITLGSCSDADVDKGDIGEIWGIYIDPKHWRKGIGRLLCRKGEEVLRSLGYTVVVLRVFEANDQARGFYEAMGFEADGSAKELTIGVALAAIRYRKELRKLGNHHVC